MNQLQKWCESSAMGIPVVVSMDSVHGASYVNGATVTGHNLALAATRDEDIVTQLAEIQRQELMAIGVRMTLSPEADIASEPRWGRVMETFGEDPDLVTEMVTAQIVAYQNGADGVNEDGVIACIKHFPGAGPQMDGLDQAPIVSDEATLQTHLKPYYAAIKVNVGAVMPYYSIPLVLDTTAALGSKATLQDLLRDEMGFTGIIQTDWGMIWGIQQSTSMWGEECSEEQAILTGVMDAQVDAIGGESIKLIDEMEELYNAGSITDEVLNEACTHILKEKFELGIFENPYVDVADAVAYVGSDENQAVNLKAAEESMTLLKNDGILPLDSANKKILVAGLRAGDMDSLCGGWTSSQEGSTLVDALTALAGEGAQILYDGEDIEKITADAAQCDVAIVTVGEVAYQHNPPWGYDTLEITDSQQQVLEAVKATGIPIITVVIGGRPYILTWCDENTNAILMAYYPGQQGGTAIAETLYGINNPTGRLPVAMPRDMESVEKQESDVCFDLENPLYNYGFGLSYSE
jgi:beta-glucosidase